MEDAGVDRFEGGGDVTAPGLGDSFHWVSICSAGGGFKGDFVDAGGAGGGEGEVVFTACDEGVPVGQLPVFAWGVLEVEGGAFEGVKTPEAGYGSGDGVAIWGVGAGFGGGMGSRGGRGFG